MKGGHETDVSHATQVSPQSSGAGAPKLCQACILDFRVLRPDPMFTLWAQKCWFLLSTEHYCFLEKPACSQRVRRAGRRPAVDPDNTGADNFSMSRFRAFEEEGVSAVSKAEQRCRSNL